MPDTEWTSQLYEGDISTYSAYEPEPETDAEIEIIIGDGDTDTDEECNAHADTNETKHSEWLNKECEEASVERPHVGMLFDTAEDAYEFYDRYARMMGFSIRRGSSRRSRKNDVVIWRQYLCFREGWRRDKNDKTEEARVKQRRETRVGCQACLAVKLQVTDGTWVVTLFKEKHNHNFETPKKQRLLPSKRKIDGNQEDLTPSMSKTDVKTNLMLNYLSEEAGGSQNRELIDRELTSESFEGEIYAHSANESEHETQDEIEVIVDDEDSDEDCNIKGDMSERQHGEEEDNIEKPRVGMLFDSAEDAHQFYKRYARETGFRVRKGSSRRSRKNDDIIWRQFLCFREGRRCENKKKSGVKHHRETRIGCQANLVVKLRTEDGTWIVSTFEEKHNHDYVKRHLLPSHRRIDESEGDMIHGIVRANVETDIVMNCLSEEAGVRSNDNSIYRDVQNHAPIVRKVELRMEDTEPLLQYFNALQEIPYFLRHNSLCHQGMTIAAKGASSMEAYKVATHWLEKALIEIEKELKTGSCTGSDKDNAAKFSSVDGSANQVLICDTQNVKNKWQPCSKDLDQRMKKKYKQDLSMASKEKENEGVQGQMNESAKGPDDSTMIVEARSD